MITLGALEHEVPVGGRGDRTAFDAEGYVVGRQVFSPDVLRKLRGPLVERLISDGHVEEVEGEEDLFRWIGDRARFDQPAYKAAIRSDMEELLLCSGVASAAIERMWGRRPAIWTPYRFMAVIPGAPDRVHRDGWLMSGVGAPADHANLWAPLTRIDEDGGPLAIALGTHRIPDAPADVPMPYPIHKDVLANTGHLPSEEALAPLWRTTRFEVGDALVFRPDIVHGTAPNNGPYLRLAIGLIAQDAGVPLANWAGLSLDSGRDLSDVEWLTLALLALQPTSSWLASCAFYPRGIIGRLGIEQSQDRVGASFATLRARGLIEAYETNAETQEAIHGYAHATADGRSRVSEWLLTPSPNDPHLLSVKLLFCDWLGLDGRSLLTDGPEAADERSHQPPGSEMASALADSTP